MDDFASTKINNLTIVWKGLFYYQFYVREFYVPGCLCTLFLQRKPAIKGTGCSCSGLLYLNHNTNLL